MKTPESITFICGHNAELKPGLFGRGKVRLERLEQYSNRNCFSCAVKNAQKLVNSFTTVKGKPLTQEAKNQSLVVRIMRLEVSYNRSINMTE